MGDIAGSAIGAIGGLIGGQQQASAAKQAAQIQAAAADRAGERALTGFRYMTEGPGAEPMNAYITQGQRALGQQGTTQNLLADLLGVTGYGAASQPQQAAATAQQGPVNAFQTPEVIAQRLPFRMNDQPVPPGLTYMPQLNQYRGWTEGGN